MRKLEKASEDEQKQQKEKQKVIWFAGFELGTLIECKDCRDIPGGLNSLPASFDQLAEHIFQPGDNNARAAQNKISNDLMITTTMTN